MNVYGCLEWIDRGHGNIKDNKSFFTILFTADYTEPQRMMKYLISFKNEITNGGGDCQ